MEFISAVASVAFIGTEVRHSYASCASTVGRATKYQNLGFLVWSGSIPVAALARAAAALWLTIAQGLPFSVGSLDAVPFPFPLCLLY
jgi:hypothetical protein